MLLRRNDRGPDTGFDNGLLFLAERLHWKEANSANKGQPSGWPSRAFVAENEHTTNIACVCVTQSVLLAVVLAPLVIHGPGVLRCPKLQRAHYFANKRKSALLQEMSWATHAFLDRSSASPLRMCLPDARRPLRGTF